jgi:hypothetical protein
MLSLLSQPLRKGDTMEYGTQMTLRVPAPLHRRIAAIARARGVSNHAACLDLLREAAFRAEKDEEVAAVGTPDPTEEIAAHVAKW